MDICPVLTALQGTMLSADNMHDFSKLTARGGNEETIDLVIDIFSTFLKETQCVVEGKILSSSITEFRKVALYIVLNADLPVLQQMIDFNELNSIIWSIPNIPKCLMCELMWNLHMEGFISEVISYCSPQLALEVASAFLDHFKYFNPLDCLKQLQLLSSVCYILICRLHLFDLESPDLENKSTAAFNNFQKCLKYYTTPPNNHKLNDLGKGELYRYQGDSLYSLLQLIDECLIQFMSKLEVNPATSEVYKITHVMETMKTDHPTYNLRDSTNTILLECLNNANTAMLDTCKVLVMDVSIDVFCCWSEFEEDGISMQQTVGELCYKVHSKLTNLPTLVEHPLVNMLEQISRKPVEMKEKINATEDNDIIEIIKNNSEERLQWIKGLVYKEKLCQNSELLDIVHTNLDVYNQHESYKLYTVLKKYNSLDLENKDLVEQLGVKVFEKCDLPKKYDILDDVFSNKVFINMKETPEFTDTMTSTFNKLIASPDADLTDVLTLFLQNPQEVLTRIFNLASENMQQASIMLDVMKLLDRFSDHYYSTETESCFIQTTQKLFEVLDTEPKQDNFIQFVFGLKEAGIIPGTKLLLLVIMTNMHKALVRKDVGSLYVQLKLLQEAYELHELMEYRAPMLAMLAQVLDAIRWQMNSFTPIAPAALTLGIAIQNTLIDSYDGMMPESQSQWLKSKLKHLRALNMYYYRSLWNPPGSNYLEVVSGMTVSNDMPLDWLTSWLAQILGSCTQQEWCEVWDSLTLFSNHKILNIIHTAVAMLTIAEKSNRTDNSCNCIFNCYRNFMYVTRYKFFTEPVTDEQVQSIIKKAAMITELVPEESVEDFGTVLMPIFAYLTEKQDDYEDSLAECLDTHLGPTKLSPMVKKVFLNGSA